MTEQRDREPLGPGMTKFGEDLVALARQHHQPTTPLARRKWFRRPAILAGAATLVLAGGAGAAALLSIGEPVPERTDAPPHAQQLGARTLAVTARDPRDAVMWGAAVYSLKDGKRCVIAGRVHNGQVGQLVGRIFRPYSGTDYGGICGRPADDRFFFAAGPARDDPTRNLVVGRAGDDVRALRIRTADGDRRIDVGPDGAFLLVYDGDLDAASVKIEVDSLR